MFELNSDIMKVIATSKIYDNFQTSIPKIIRDNVELENRVLEWSIEEDGKIIVTPRKLRNIKDLKGLVKLDCPTDSVELKKELYK